MEINKISISAYITHHPYVAGVVVSWKQMCARNEVTSGRGLAMDHRLRAATNESQKTNAKHETKLFFTLVCVTPKR